MTKRTTESTLLTIDRSHPFDPSHLPGGLSIWREDDRALAVTELDLSKVLLWEIDRGEEDLDGELSMDGEEVLRALKDANYIPLDAKTMQTLLAQDLVPKEWEERAEGIVFLGSIFRDQYMVEEVFALDWHSRSQAWRFECGLFDASFQRGAHAFAVIPA